MGNIKASAYIPVLEGHLGHGYVYGAVGQTCTVSLLQAKHKQYGKIMADDYYQKNGDYMKGLCARWLGQWVADCSGLIKARAQGHLRRVPGRERAGHLKPDLTAICGNEHIDPG